MTPSISVTLVNQLSEVERLSRLVEAFGEAEGLGPEAVFSINLALDEVVTNVIRYAHDDDGRQHPIVVRLALEQDVLTAQVEDDGRAFNPLEMPAPDIGAIIDEYIHTDDQRRDQPLHGGIFVLHQLGPPGGS